MDVTGLTCLIISILMYNVTAIEDITFCGPFNLTCQIDLPVNLTCGFEWKKNQQKIDGENRSIFFDNIKNDVKYTCTVLDPCGNFSNSSYEYKFHCSMNAMTVLVICGVGAIIIILAFGITMKLVLKRGEAQRQNRRQQRQAMQTNDSTATVTSYW